MFFHKKPMKAMALANGALRSVRSSASAASRAQLAAASWLQRDSTWPW